jgi:predicted DNA-binding transcriptional regulator YafY
MSPVVTFEYTNHRGQTRQRKVIPVSIRFGSAEWHPDPQWLLEAFDLDKQSMRTFALLGISSWNPSEV